MAGPGGLICHQLVQAVQQAGGGGAPLFLPSEPSVAMFKWLFGSSEKDKAAAKIQAHYRGKKTRSDFAYSKCAPRVPCAW